MRWFGLLERSPRFLSPERSMEIYREGQTFLRTHLLRSQQSFETLGCTHSSCHPSKIRGKERFTSAYAQKYTNLGRFGRGVRTEAMRHMLRQIRDLSALSMSNPWLRG